MDNQHSKSVSFKYILYGLLVIGIFFRFYQLGSIPSGLVRDETSNGYNSWLVSKTGRDEWGETMPVHFRAFSEWKLPGYIYSLIPFVRIIGLNAIGIRMVSGLAGIGSAVIWYLIWSERKDKLTAKIGALFVLFSFWIFPIVRIGFQINLAIFFFLLGWLLWIKEKYFFSIGGFLGAVYTYNVFRIFTPLFFGWLAARLILQSKDIKKIILLIVFGIGCLPIVYFYAKEPTAFLRAQQTGIQEVKLNTIISNYVNHLNPNFLLISGDDNLRHSPGVTGQISYLAMALAVIGLLSADSSSLFLILVGPLPAVITKISPHSLRSIVFMIGIYSLVTIGVSSIIKLFKKTNYKIFKVVIIISLVVGLVQYGYFYYDYFFKYPARAADVWQTGYKQVYAKIKDVNTEVYFDWTYTQPYIYKLFFEKLNIFEQDVDVGPPDIWYMSRVTRINNVHYLSCDNLKEIFNQPEFAYFVLTRDCDFELETSKIVDRILIDGHLRFIIATNNEE